MRERQSFEGKHAVITGGSRGIGLATATNLAERGATVIVAAKDGSDELDQLMSRTNTTLVKLDLAAADAGDLLAEQVTDVDILVNNVGLAKARTGGFLSITDQDWLLSFSLNVFAAVRVTRALLPRMLDRSGASIVNTVSVNAELPDPAVMDYSSAKAALANFSKSLSKEYGSKVRVNWVNPGPVSTALWLGQGGIADTFSAATGQRPEAVEQQAVAGTDTKRFSTPSEVAELIAFLAGPTASNITGAGFRIDGGLVATI